MKLTKAQCWIHIDSLPMEYWHPKATFFITKEIGTPLTLDDCTMNTTCGFYVRMPVDVDLLSSARTTFSEAFKLSLCY